MIVRDLTFRPADPSQFTRGLRRPWDAARALGLRGATVSRRLAAMRESGLLRGVVLQPAAALVERRLAEFLVEYPDAATKRRALPTLREEPALWSYHGYVGRAVSVTLAAPADADPMAVATDVGAGTGARRVLFHHGETWPIETDGVSATDLRILAAFSDDALRPAREVAREVGVQARTVTNRLRALARMRAFEAHVALDFERASPGLAVDIDAQIDPGHSTTVHAELARRFPLAMCRTFPGAENASIVLFVGSASELEDHVARAEGIPHVRHVEARLLREAFFEPARWQDALLAAAPVPR